MDVRNPNLRAVQFKSVDVPKMTIMGIFSGGFLPGACSAFLIALTVGLWHHRDCGRRSYPAPATHRQWEHAR
jgi:hypothetical protein